MVVAFAHVDFSLLAVAMALPPAEPLPLSGPNFAYGAYPANSDSRPNQVVPALLRPQFLTLLSS